MTDAIRGGDLLHLDAFHHQNVFLAFLPSTFTRSKLPPNGLWHDDHQLPNHFDHMDVVLPPVLPY